MRGKQLICLTLAALLLLCGCTPNEATTPSTEAPVVTEPVVQEPLAVAERSLLLNTGDSQLLTVTGGNGATYTSSNPQAVQVDGNGVVTAVGKGNALITVTVGDQTAYCGVLVDSQGQFLDARERTAEKVFSDIMLYELGLINGVAISPKGDAVYLSQQYGISAYVPVRADYIVTEINRDDDGNWSRGSWMRFYESGYGYLSAEAGGDGTWLWVESNGSSTFGSGASISRVAWEDEGVCQQSYGQTFTLGGGYTAVSPTVDAENDLVMVYDDDSETYLLYSRQALMNGEPEEYLLQVACPSYQTPAAGEDDSQGRYNASVRGFALADGYIYQLSGSSSIYISVFDLNGTLQYCYRIPDFPETPVRMPCAMAIQGGKIYLAIASGSSSCYLANLWVL